MGIFTKRKRTGSPTNASDAVDNVELPPDATEEDVLDEGLQSAFNNFLQTSPCLR